LDRYEDFLKEWILVGHKSDWKPNVYGQVKSWIDGGEPRAVTRDDWGIDVPVAGAEGKKYMFGLTLLSDIFPLPKNGPREKVKKGTVLEDQDTKLVHFIGKDNIVFIV
jgi:methionyl-tRNA synthetase